MEDRSMTEVTRVTQDTWGVFSGSSVLAAVVIQPEGEAWAVRLVSPPDGRVPVVVTLQAGLTWAEAENVASSEALRLARNTDAHRAMAARLTGGR